MSASLTLSESWENRLGPQQVEEIAKAESISGPPEAFGHYLGELALKKTAIYHFLKTYEVDPTYDNGYSLRRGKVIHYGDSEGAEGPPPSPYREALEQIDQAGENLTKQALATFGPGLKADRLLETATHHLYQGLGVSPQLYALPFQTETRYLVEEAESCLSHFFPSKWPYPPEDGLYTKAKLIRDYAAEFSRPGEKPPPSGDQRDQGKAP